MLVTFLIIKPLLSLVSVSLQSIADYFTEAHQGFNWISLETGAMVIGGLEGFMNSKLYCFHFFGRFFMFLLAFLFYVFIFIFIQFLGNGRGGVTGNYESKYRGLNCFSRTYIKPKSI